MKFDGYNELFNSARGENTGFAISLMPMLRAKFYEDNPIARRIIDVVPEEMVTPGFGIDGVDDEKAFKSLWDGLKLNEQLICGLAWGRLFGGAAIVAIVNDGGSLQTQVRKGGRLEAVRVYERDQVVVDKRETNPRNPRYNMPKTYKVSPGDELMPYIVHHSRIYIIDGDRVARATRKLNNGWGASVLNRGLVDAIQDYDYCEQLATQLLRRKQQAVWKAKNLSELCDDSEGEYAARIRLAQVDDNSGVGQTIGVDAIDEDYEVLNSDINGVDAFLDKKFDRIVALSGIHEIILKSRNVGGVSASQNVALETFYKLIERKRNEDYRPLLEWIIPFLIDVEEWSIRFEPLSLPSEKEQSETFNKNVDSVTKLIQDELIDQEEARDTLEAMSDVLKLKPKPDQALMGGGNQDKDPGINDNQSGSEGE